MKMCDIYFIWKAAVKRGASKFTYLTERKQVRRSQRALQVKIDTLHRKGL